MRYMLLIYGDEAGRAHMTEDDAAADWKTWLDYGDWLTQKGWMRGGEPLHDTGQATSVRVRDGERITTDGPFAETKEQLGGYYIVETDNLDDAIEAAGRCPGALYGTLEVRPIMDLLPGGAPEMTGA